MGKRGPGDQTDRKAPYGYPGDGQWHMGNYMKEGQGEAPPNGKDASYRDGSPEGYTDEYSPTDFTSGGSRVNRKTKGNKI